MSARAFEVHVPDPELGLLIMGPSKIVAKEIEHHLGPALHFLGASPVSLYLENSGIIHIRLLHGMNMELNQLVDIQVPIARLVPTVVVV